MKGKIYWVKKYPARSKSNFLENIELAKNVQRFDFKMLKVFLCTRDILRST